MISINEPRKSPPFALFNLGFRPFFLLGALSAAVMIAVWLVLYSSGLTLPYYSNTLYWHAHEMLLGFTLAIIAGFLLTAVRNWTSVQTIYGAPLAVLTVVWLSARILPLLPVPGWLVAAVDLAFAPVLTVAIAYPILRARNYRNLLFVPILSAFFIANLLVHLELLGITEATAMTGLHLALYLVVMVISVIGGRVIPFFTERGVSGVSCTRYDSIEKVIVPATALWLIGTLSGITAVVVTLSALLSLLSAVRLYGWFSTRVATTPLVWILHAGYAFLPLGFAFTACAALGWVSPSIAIHAFAAGSIGLMTLGMMARVSLGHTGRPLAVGPLMISAFVLMLLAALVRVSVTWLPIPYLAGLHLSGTLWILAWLLFLVRYLPILSKPRADGLFG